MNNLVFLNRSLDYGGAERQLVTLVKELDKEVFDISVLSFYSGGLLTKQLEGEPVRLISLEKRGRWDVLGFARRLIDKLRLLRPDIVHSYLDIPNILTVFIKLFSPSTKIIWWEGASKTDLSRYVWPRRLGFQLERFLSRFADRIIVNSYAGRDYLHSKGFPADKMVIISSGIDTKYFRPDPEARARVRDEWKISDEMILIGMVARFDPIKDHRSFLKAAALLSEEREDVRFVCVGGGDEDYAARLRRLSDQLGLGRKIIWAGVCSDMPGIYNSLDIACACSDYGEGFPNVIGEAMACDVPCVVTDTGDSARIVAEMGFVVPPGDAHALAEGLKLCIAQTQSKTEGRVRARIVENFSVERMVEQTAAAILEMV